REPPRRAASYVDKDKCQRSRRKHQIGSQGARDSWRLRRREAGVAPLGVGERCMTAFRAAQGTELRLQLIVNNQPVAAAEGDTVAAALLASGRWTFRRDYAGAARGPFCLMGVCQECLV